MNKFKVMGRSGAGLLALAIGLTSASGAGAQEAQPTPPPAPSSEAPIGPRELRNFSITPRQRIVTQPAPAPAQPQPAPTPAPPPAAARPEPPVAASRPTAQPARPLPTTPRPPAAAAPGAARPPAPDTASPVPAPAEPVAATTPLPSAPALPAEAPAPALPPAPDTAAPPSSPSPSADGPPLWILLLGGIAFGLVGYTLITRRRRAAGRRALALSEPGQPTPVKPQTPRAPRPDPVPRPWLEVELLAERTTADPDESVVEFELTLRNSGGSTAQNVLLQAKLICSTPNQDKEIAAFHRLKPGEHRTLKIPDLPAGQELKMKGRVDIKRDDIRALRVEQRLLFVPLVAVNAFYEWGTERAGQTSKSFLVGREQADASEKMAPFRLDLGPRVYRTVGQRPYNVERRV